MKSHKKDKPNPIEEFQLVLLGDPTVGKTSIARRFVQEIYIDYYEACTIEDSYRKFVDIDGEKYLVEIIDSIPHEALQELCIKNRNYFIITYSIDSRTSFDKVTHFMSEIQRINESKPYSVMILGNKKDLNLLRVISMEQGQALASNLGCLFMEVSALTGENVNQAFHHFIQHSSKKPKKIPPFSEIGFNTDPGLMSRDMERLFNSPTFSDLKIIVTDGEQQQPPPEHQQQKIFLHQFVVGIRFPAFLEFFTKDNTFFCHNVPYDQILAITRWIYTGVISHPTLDVSQLRPSILKLNVFPLLSYVAPTTPTTPPKISFSEFFNEKTLSDVIFCIQNQEIYGHRALVGIRSTYFQSMFTKGFQESFQSKIVINNVGYQPFFELMKYIYTGIFNSERDVMETLEIAHMYDVPGLVNDIGQYLWENANIDNIVDLYGICLRYPEMSRLMEKVKYIVGYYLHKVVTTPSFKRLDNEHQEILRNMLIPGTWYYPDQDKYNAKQNCSIQ